MSTTSSCTPRNDRGVDLSCDVYRHDIGGGTCTSVMSRFVSSFHIIRTTLIKIFEAGQHKAEITFFAYSGSDS